MRNSILSALLAGFLASNAVASDQQSGHGDHSTMDHGTMDHSSMEHGSMDHGTMGDGIHTEVTVHSIADGTVNVSHGPIPEIGWPAMTMDLNILEGAELGDVKAGDEAMMMLEKGEDGMFAIRALMPME